MEDSKSCICPEIRCKRHGNCAACWEHHAGLSHPAYCKRGESLPQNEEKCGNKKRDIGDGRKETD